MGFKSLDIVVPAMISYHLWGASKCQELPTMFTCSTSFNPFQFYGVLLSFLLYSLQWEGIDRLINLPRVHITLLLKLVFSVICCVS